MKLLFSKTLCFFIISGLYFHHPKAARDEKQFPKGDTIPALGSLEQLRHYPLPRFFPSNSLAYLFNWMDPMYMGGNGQPGIERAQAITRAESIQKELSLNWHYGIVLSNAGCAFNQTDADGAPLFVKLANEHPEIPLDLITFWMAGDPRVAGYSSNRAMILSTELNPAWTLNFDVYGSPHTEIKYTFPDSLIRMDGATQKFYIAHILQFLKRPITRINENGEEPPGPYMLKAMKNDEATKKRKEEMKIDSWEDFMAVRKLQMRNVYTLAFMNTLPELKHTIYSMYIIEGGPVDRYKWSIMKKIQTPQHGMYYSTPDFYPRWPKNWKDWSGPWHGWSWIDYGRKTEIKAGDKLFSPFVCAGWSDKPEEDVRPGQWLGLLKCLSVIGAEYYYTGYFNLHAPFTNPGTYVWQAAMPAYAQAITSRFEDVLRDGDVLYDADGIPRITWKTEDPHVLITVRKHSKKEKYIICGTYQPFSNDANEIPEKRNVTIHLGAEDLSFEIRRQGSIYVYEKTPAGKTLFYQIDSWHENAHPDYWSDDFRFEAEVADATLSNDELVTTSEGNPGDYTHATTYLKMSKGLSYSYNFEIRDGAKAIRYVWIRYKGKGSLTVECNPCVGCVLAPAPKTLPNAMAWKWLRFEISARDRNKLSLNLNDGQVDLDKIVVTTKDIAPE
ncbi:MAG TPA: hypothetical protein VNZ86_13835 [Bacteroidia bacterium]|jgi:hypothetical protein|nr:hypothetical protein [Bacteroidia bacterium]